MSTVADRVKQALAPVITAAGFDLEAVDVQAAGRRRLIRLLVDRDGGVTLDDIASLTSIVSDELDETNAMGEQPYVLEVSSLGVGRPLTLPRHWRRNATRLVRVTLADGDHVVGRIGASDDTSVSIEPVGDRRRRQTDEIADRRMVPYADISEAHVEVEFRRPVVDGDLPVQEEA